jgi:hypothetical protein
MKQKGEITSVDNWLPMKDVVGSVAWLTVKLENGQRMSFVTRIFTSDLERWKILENKNEMINREIEISKFEKPFEIPYENGEKIEATLIIYKINLPT